MEGTMGSSYGWDKMGDYKALEAWKYQQFQGRGRVVKLFLKTLE